MKSIVAPNNRLTVKLQDGTERIYDPRRQQGVSVFQEEMRSFSVGDRIQFTAAANSTMSALPASDSETFFIRVNFCEPASRNCPLRVRWASTATLRCRNSPGAYWASSMSTGGG